MTEPIQISKEHNIWLLEESPSEYARVSHEIHQISLENKTFFCLIKDPEKEDKYFAKRLFELRGAFSENSIDYTEQTDRRPSNRSLLLQPGDLSALESVEEQWEAVSPDFIYLQHSILKAAGKLTRVTYHFPDGSSKQWCCDDRYSDFNRPQEVIPGDPFDGSPGATTFYLLGHPYSHQFNVNDWLVTFYKSGFHLQGDIMKSAGDNLFEGHQPRMVVELLRYLSNEGKIK